MSAAELDVRVGGRGTEMVLYHAQFFNEAIRDGHRSGWSEAFVKLERILGEKESEWPT